MNRELLEKVLEIFEPMNPEQARLINDIESELEKPEPEPVGYVHKMYKTHMINNGNSFLYPDGQYGHDVKLFEHPELQQKPLSDDEIVKLWGEPFSGTTQIVKNFARAIEKHHGIE